MKSRKQPKGSITEPVLRDMLDRQKADSEAELKNITVGSKPLPSPDLYQDPGGGYNPDFTFPQE